jgi:trk system potassium uptake protein TrkH
VRRLFSPVRALALSFAFVILTGTVLLRQPWAAVPGRQLAWVEALFTATSETCVTGLAIRPPSDHTVAGQLVIIGLIQIGGLGIITFGMFFALLAGGRLSLFGRELVLSSLAHEPWEDFWPLLRTVVGATLAIEGIGALLLAAAWWGEKGVLALPWGAYHAVSAFCNAGFGLHQASLIPWRDNPFVIVPIGLLIVCGGLGFLPLAELFARLRRGSRRPLSLHTRVVLTVTAALLLIGWAGFALLEAGTTLAGLSFGERALAVWFQGITPRTAGFASLDYGAMTGATLIFTMVLMFVGASPGSTGGGVKTTTVGVLLSVLIARVRAHRQVSALGRGIRPATVATAIVVLTLSLLVVVAGMMAVSACEHGIAGGAPGSATVVWEAFDVVSAFGTVGLSTGITPRLQPSSWLVLTLVMFIGRVGPLTLGLALAGRPPHVEPRFAEEELMVG